MQPRLTFKSGSFKCFNVNQLQEVVQKRNTGQKNKNWDDSKHQDGKRSCSAFTLFIVFFIDNYILSFLQSNYHYHHLINVPAMLNIKDDIIL